MVAEMLRLLKHYSSGVEAKRSTVGCVYGPGAMSLPGSEGVQTWLQDQSAQDLSEVLGYRGKLFHETAVLKDGLLPPNCTQKRLFHQGRKQGPLCF